MTGRHSGKDATARADGVDLGAPASSDVRVVDDEEVASYGPLRLSRGTTRTNLSAYYWMGITSIMIFTFVPAAQTAVLSTLLQVPEDERGGVVGTAGLISEIVLILTVGLAGAWSDRIGRRPIVVGGYAIMGAGIALTPFVGSVLPFYAARGVASVGIAMITVMLTAVVADYVRNETRGKANGLLGVMNGVGALVTFFLLLKLPTRFESGGLDETAALRATYLTVAGLALLTALLLQLFLRRGRTTEHTEHIPITQLLVEGLKEAKRPGISFSYVSAFVARADLALLGAFLVLWAQQYASNELGLGEAEALAKAGILLGVANGMAFIGAPLIGIISDRVSRKDAVLLSLAIAAVGYMATLLIENPFSPIGYAVAMLIGLGQVAAVISSQVLVAEQAPVATRGSVVGMFALFGGVGIMLAFGIGGPLYDAWRPAGPFFLFGLLSAAAFVYGLIVRKKIPNKPHEAMDHLDDISGIPAGAQ